MTTDFKIINLQGKNFTVLEGRHADFWKVIDTGSWEKETFDFLERACNSQSIFIDVGAWIGLMALFAARKNARIIAIEPDPIAFAELKSNLRENGFTANIINKAVDARNGKIKLFAPEKFGQSISSTFSEGTSDYVEVETITFPQISKMIPARAKVVLKIDIEGHEYSIIPTFPR